MTTFRLFIHRRDSVRWLVLAMAAGSIALAMAALACGPAAPTSPGAGETAANAAASDQPPSDGAEPITIPQQASGTDETPTPRPTICASTFDDNGQPSMFCVPAPPLPTEHTNVEGTLLHLVDEARRAQNQGATGSSQGEPPARHMLLIELEHGNNGDAVFAWLKRNNYRYKHYQSSGNIYASIAITDIPALAEVEGVLALREPLGSDPAN